MKEDVTLLRQHEQVFVIKALIVFRIAVISFFLGTVILFQHRVGELFFPLPISLLIVATYTISIFYLFLLNRISRYTLFLYSQLVLDIVIESGIIYYTGGVESPFTFLYIFTIIATAIVLPQKASYVISSAASIMYGLLVVLEFYGVIEPLPLIARNVAAPTQSLIFFKVLINMAAFYMVAFLSEFLSQRLRQTLFALRTKSQDLTYLQEFHEMVISNMGNGFLALDMRRRINSANRAAEKILEMKIDDMKFKRIDEALASIPANDLLPDPDDTDRGIKQAEWAYKTESGKMKTISATSSLFRDSQGTVRGFIIVFHDITQMKEMENAVAKSERLAAIGRMAAGLAHEIRNPLGSISGSIQMLKSEITNELSPSQDRLMAITLKETERLNHIINSFLLYATPEIRKTKNVKLANLLNDAVVLFANDTRYSGTVETETDLNEGVLMEAASESLKQVFWNFLINAAQAMPEGGKITVAMKPYFTENGDAKECTISFSDTGVGIPESEKRNIFEPFHTTKPDGTGLGLSTALKIIESHSGSINVSSVEGQGATFTITLPISSVETPAKL